MRIYTVGNANSSILATPYSDGSPLLRSWGATLGSLEQILTAIDQAGGGDTIDWEQHARDAADDVTPFAMPAQFQAPIRWPTKILCVGRNYADHATETGSELPNEPLIFSKLPTTLIGHGAKIVLPNASNQVDFEAELVVVIGKQCRKVSEGSALKYVAGYTCGNDISARDWQTGKPGQQWLLGKSFDTFAPLGPCLVTADEIPDPQSLSIELRLNGEVMQQANTRDMIFPVARLIAYVSQVCTLCPGDLLFTGTPAGVGMAREPAVFLKPGDCVEVEVEGIGCLANECVAA